MITTHPDDVGHLIAQHVHCAEAEHNRARERVWHVVDDVFVASNDRNGPNLPVPG
jgi:hypothetical protein